MRDKPDAVKGAVPAEEPSSTELQKKSFNPFKLARKASNSSDALTKSSLSQILGSSKQAEETASGQGSTNLLQAANAPSSGINISITTPEDAPPSPSGLTGRTSTTVPPQKSLFGLVRSKSMKSPSSSTTSPSNTLPRTGSKPADTSTRTSSSQKDNHLKTNLVKNNPLAASMPLNNPFNATVTNPDGSTESSQEEMDQVSELNLVKSFGSAMHLSNAPPAGGGAPTATLTAPSPGSKHGRSLPKIASVFTKKPSGSSGKTRAASETPDKVGAMTSNQTLGFSPVTTSTRAGGLSAYEIGPSAPVSKSYVLDDFNVIKKVGKGGFATVYLVRLKKATGKYFALKAIKKADLVKLKQEKQILNEKNILNATKHAFIIELFSTFQDTYHLYMILEYVAGGDLFSYLRRSQRFPENDARFYTSEVLVALEYLHSQNVIYRDLKPENILLDTTGHIKVADFGFAKVIRGTTNSFCGTPDYIAVELVINRPYNKMVDWWSLGVLVFELVSGKTPFGDDTSEKIYENIQSGSIKWHPLVKNAAKDLVRRLLDPDPVTRLGAGKEGPTEIKNHPWFKELNWKKVESRTAVPPYVPACEPPETIEKQKAAKGGEDCAETLKNVGQALAKDGKSWLGKGGDPFHEYFKDF